MIDSPCGLRFCFEKLSIQAGFSRRFLLEKEMMTSDGEILSVYSRIDELRCIFCKPENRVALQTLEFKLQGIKDVEQTVKKVDSNRLLDDIELFEIKHLALLSLDVLDILSKYKLSSKLEKRMDEVVDLLDPDGLRISSFYIYDSYSPELGELRKVIKSTPEGEYRQSLISKSFEMEAVIRKRISVNLRKYSSLLLLSLYELADIDIAVAKGIMMRDMELVFPTITDGECSLKGLFNPVVKDSLEANHKEFQRVDISYGKLPTLIIGANMGGKTVVLKSLALCQYLFQFGFPVPAKTAEIAVRRDVFLIAGDSQSEIKGLSSFAAEMKNIDEVIKSNIEGDKILALIDEPARSTNPIEGTALVSSLITVLSRRGIALVLTTHYNVAAENCRRLKVKGLMDGVMNYALSECSASEVPHEALNVALSLDISREWIDEANKILKKTNLN